MDTIGIDGQSLTLNNVWDVCRNFQKVEISESAGERVAKSREFVEAILKENRVVYGITTGVGDLVKTVISPKESEKLQENLLRSHAVGVGEPFPEDVVRGMILLRANALAKGYSGVRKKLISFLIELLNRRIYPFVPSQGSVGASGDLAPLAHLALVIIGEGECLEHGKRVPSLKILREKKIKPLRLVAKEGLALINGTQVMTSIGCLAAGEADLLMKNAQTAGALSLEALKGTARALDPKIHELRPYRGQIRCAKNMRRLVAGSAIIASHRNCEKVQDAYSLRCIPQVYGSILDTVEYVKSILSIEINSATDNPLVFADEKEVISAGNFHGEPLAFAMDFLGIALSEIGSVSERTVDRLVNPYVSGLPPFLVKKSGLNSGLMIAQYTAAALVSENKVLAFPSSVDSIPTSAGQEDHVSMGTISARHAWRILQNVENILAIEMICSAQGIDFHALSPGKGTRAAYRTIREHIKPLEDDRVLYKDIDKAKQLIVSGEIVRKVEQAIGPLE